MGLGITTAYKASYELEEKDILIEIVEIKDEQIQNKDALIFNLNQDKEDLNSLYSSAEEEIERRKELQNIAEENIDNLTKQVDKLNKDKFINRILIPVVALLSALLGYNLAN